MRTLTRFSARHKKARRQACERVQLDALTNNRPISHNKTPQNPPRSADGLWPPAQTSKHIHSFPLSFCCISCHDRTIRNACIHGHCEHEGAASAASWPRGREWSYKRSRWVRAQTTMRLSQWRWRASQLESRVKSGGRSVMRRSRGRRSRRDQCVGCVGLSALSYLSLYWATA